MSSRDFYRGVTISLLVAAGLFTISLLGFRQIPFILLTVSALILIFAGAGIISGLLAVIPPLRRYARRTKAGRRNTLILLASLSFVVEFAFWLFVMVNIFIYGTHFSVNSRYDEEKFDTFSAPTVIDTWRRELIPPPLRDFQPKCYSDKPEVCELVIHASRDYKLGSSGWYSYLGAAVFCLPTLAASLVIAEKITSPSITAQ